MKPIFYATLLATTALLTPAHADSSATISTVQQSTIKESTVFKDILKQIDAERMLIQADLSKKEKELKKKDQELAEAQKKLSAEEFEKKRKAFATLLDDVRFGLERKKIRIELAFEEAKGKVIAEFSKIVESIRAKKGGVVLYTEMVAASDPKADISPEVLKELNKKLTNVKVTFKSDDEIKKLISQQQQAAK